MCGIAGILGRDNYENANAKVKKMMAQMESRGPDTYGFYQEPDFTLGHRRLKVIDLSDNGNQPFLDPMLGLNIVFNGCIYNYKELRRELEQLGYEFQSTSDTEVILKSYHRWKEECLQKLNGMFAFCITDMKTGDAFMARDRLGIKPFYYHYDQGKLHFASSLPALVKGMGVKPEVDPQALQFYLHFHSIVPAPMTIFKDFSKLEPGYWMFRRKDGTLEKQRYWNMEYGINPAEKDWEEADWLNLLEGSLNQSVQRRMVADVPVGVLLSGGLDSSLIVALLRKQGQKNLQTFSIGFESVGETLGDEFYYSDIIVKEFQTRHHQIRIPTSEMLLQMNECIKTMNEPMVSHDNIGFYLLSREVSKHLKVVQSGQGADEVFAGYHWYPPLENTDSPFQSYRDAFFDRDEQDYKACLQDGWQHPYLVDEYVKGHFQLPGARDHVDKALRLDTQVMLVDDPVKRVDSQTMAFGLEARVPFLDHELVELAARIPSKFKLAQEGKGILKTLGRKIMPNEVIDRPKGYFPVPALKYLKGEPLDFVKRSLSDPAAKKRDFYQQSYLDKLLNKPDEHITNLGGSKLWQLALIEAWLQNQGF